MGKEYAVALPIFAEFEIKVIFPASGGPGPKAQALRDWLLSKSKKDLPEKTSSFL